jgi:hypothetical protein
MSARTATRNPVVLSYYAMRRTVGLIALSLPFALAGGSILLALIGPEHALPQPIIERSISDYYYTPMGNYLIGSLCVMAAFLICSRGYDLNDEITGYLAGTFTLGVAFFPSVDPRSSHYSSFQVDVGFIHSGFAALMFLVLAYFCLFLFRRSSPGRPLTRRKRHRNRIYHACGIIIVICILVMIYLTVRQVARLPYPTHALFWCESLALAAFGIAWLTKGEGLLKDKPQNHIRPS